jgi:hypothetical protein
VSGTARNGSRPQPGGTTWISNRSRIGAVTTSPPARWKTYSATVCPTAWPAGPPARLEQPVRDDHPPGGPADRDRRRGGGQQEARLGRRRLRPDQERQAAQLDPAERDVARRVAEDVQAGVTGGGQVDRLIARHGSDRRLAPVPIPRGYPAPGRRLA